MKKESKRRTKINVKAKKVTKKPKEKNCYIENSKDSAYSNIYSISTFLISLAVFIIIILGAEKKMEDWITVVVFLITFPICSLLIKKFRKKCESASLKQSLAINVLVDVGTKIGYLNPILLLFCAISGMSESVLLSRFFALSIIAMLLAVILHIVRKYRKIKKTKNKDHIDFGDITTISEHKSHFKLVVFLLCLIILFLLLKICIHFNVINFNEFFNNNSSFNKMLYSFFTNDYVINILCTIITAVALYILQIKYSKHKIKKDFRCDEVIRDLYYGIESAQNIKSNSKALKIEINDITGDDFKEKERNKAQKYYDFYVENKQDFHLSHLALTYHNNDILIESIQMVFFINLNFKLLNIINNIKNRKPNLEEEYPEIEKLYDKYQTENQEEDFLALGRQIERYITDVVFMGGYCLDLLDYLGFDPIPTKIYITIFNSLYPTTEDLIKYNHLPKKEQYKITRAITRKASKEYILYKIKKFFK